MTKLIPALAALALLGSGAAFAANQAAAPATTPAPTATSAPAAAGTATAPAGKATATTTTPAAKPMKKSCGKQATEKKLTGKDRTQFVKDCKSGKAAG